MTLYDYSHHYMTHHYMTIVIYDYWCTDVELLMSNRYFWLLMPSRDIHLRTNEPSRAETLFKLARVEPTLE